MVTKNLPVLVMDVFSILAVGTIAYLIYSNSKGDGYGSRENTQAFEMA
ncbi:MAG: hypothetical protein AABW54_00390 [Candidatus Micrarchaeota archaeon]